MSRGVHCRAARDADVPHIIRLVRAGFSRERVALTIYGASGIEQYVADAIAGQERGAETEYLVAESNGGVIGFIETRWTPAAAILNYVAVDENARRQRVAHRLLRAALRREGDLPPLMALDVFIDNIGAMHWYRSLGFVEGPQSAWWIADELPHIASPSNTGRLRGLPQARATMERFGFGMITAVTETRTYDVGILGTETFRISSQELLDDPAAISALARFDRSRRVFVVAPASNSVLHLPSPRRVAVSMRMTASIADLRTALASP